MKDLLTTKELAEYLNINEKKIYSLIFEKGLPATKVTGKWIFPKNLVDCWIENHIQNYPWLKDKLEGFAGLLAMAGSNDILLKQAISLFKKKNPKTLPLYGDVGSMGGINALKRRWCHLCCAHLLHSEGDDYNFSYIKEALGEDTVVINFAFRKQGFVVAHGNPKNFSGFDDLKRNDITIVNRPVGTGTRFLLDYEMNKRKINSEEIKGYGHTVFGHLEVGLDVLTGKADTGLCIQAVAGLLNLSFIPVKEERFDIITKKEIYFNKNIQSFLEFLHDKEFLEHARRFQGYDLRDTGKIIYQ